MPSNLYLRNTDKHILSKAGPGGSDQGFCSLYVCYYDYGRFFGRLIGPS